MGILDRTLESRSLVRRPIHRQQFLTGPSLQFPESVSTDLAVKEDIADAYGKSSWVYSGASRIGLDSAGLKLKIFKVDDKTGDREDVTNDAKFSTITKRANERMSAFDLWECTAINLTLFGESYWEIVRDGQGFISSIWPISARSIEPIPDAKLFVSGYKFRDSIGHERTVSPDKIVYMKTYNPNDDFKGQGSISPAAQELILNLNALAWARFFFENSALPNGVITVPEEMSDPQYNRLRSLWEEGHRGLKKSRKIGILEGGMDFKEIGLSQQDIQFADQLRMSIDTILSTIGIPPAVAGRFEQAIRANAEVQEQSYWTHTIRPMLRKSESFMENILVPMMNTPHADITQFFETEFDVQFDFSDIIFMQKRAMERIEVLIRAADRGWVTPNEGREALRKIWPELALGPLSIGGNAVFTLQNLQTSGFADAEITTDKKKSTHILRKEKLLKQPENQIIGGFDPDTPEVQEFLLISRAERIFIDQNLRNDIGKVFSAAAAEGEDISALSVRLQTQFAQINQVRALRVARTEVLGSSNFAILEGYKQTGLNLQKQWLTARDSAVRGLDPKDVANHARLDGEIKETNERFSNGLLHPGDQSPGIAEEVVNCRCTTIAKVVKSVLSKSDEEKFKDAMWKQFDVRSTVFEDRIVNSLNILFSRQLNGILKDIEETGAQFIPASQGIDIVDNNIFLGDVDKSISPILDELIVVAGNDGISQAGRAR